MTKINYSKTENLLNDALLKMTVKELIQLADKPKSFTNPSHPSSLPSIQARSILLTFMENDIELISKAENIEHKNIGITKKQIRTILEHVAELKSEDWKKLKQIRERVLRYKKELWDKIPHASDAEIIERERKKHVNKRFNTKDKWLPLH